MLISKLAKIGDSESMYEIFYQCGFVWRLLRSKFEGHWLANIRLGATLPSSAIEPTPKNSSSLYILTRP